MVWVGLLGVGFLGGVASGFFGIGGGIVMIPLMRYLFGFDQHHAQGTSLAVLLLPVGILGVIKYYQAGYVHLNQGVAIAIGFIAGALLGAMGAIPRADDTLSRAFGVLLIIAGIYQFLKP
ncbi:MAG: TSUP family transporter [bacterium JZ-2024 1]